MVPSNTLETKQESIQVQERPRAVQPSTAEARKPVPLRIVPPAKPPQQPEWFRASMIEHNRIKGSSRAMDLLVAVVVHALVVGAPILAGLYFTDTLNLRQLESTFLVAPPPPPPPPPAAAPAVKAAPARRVFEHAGKLIAPTVVPKTIADIKEAPMPDADLGGGGVPGGVPGGVAGGSMGGVIGGVIGGSSSVPPPLAPRDTRPKAPVRVGGRVRPPAVLVHPAPQYPAIARQTHISGTVTIDAIIDEQGNVEEMKVVSGPPLLYQAALDALRKWKYQPTYLNDQAVPVQLMVTINFILGQ
ncbi:MAG TPA: energy transducer TonB [Candidatus Acidoferrum sp.]